MAEDNNSIFILAIICIVAIVTIVYFVGNYIETHPANSAIMLDASGQAFSAALPDAPVIKEYTTSDPCTYRYVVNKLSDTNCPKP